MGFSKSSVSESSFEFILLIVVFFLKFVTLKDEFTHQMSSVVPVGIHAKDKLKTTEKHV